MNNNIINYIVILYCVSLTIFMFYKKLKLLKKAKCLDCKEKINFGTRCYHCYVKHDLTAESEKCKWLIKKYLEVKINSPFDIKFDLAYCDYSMYYNDQFILSISSEYGVFKDIVIDYVYKLQNEIIRKRKDAEKKREEEMRTAALDRVINKELNICKFEKRDLNTICITHGSKSCWDKNINLIGEN